MSEQASENNFSLIPAPGRELATSQTAQNRILGEMVDNSLVLARDTTTQVVDLDAHVREGNKLLGSEGSGMTEANHRAFSLFLRAAEAGHAEAQYGLGRCFYQGSGVPKNYAEAIIWFRRSAEQGHAKAQNHLGLCYDRINGITNLPEALKWYRKAAGQNVANAQRRLGYLYESGRGVPQDYAEAAKCYRQAAEQGNISAQVSLGALYANGRVAIDLRDGIDTGDVVEAYKYVKLAEEKGYEGAANTLAVISALLLPEDIREGERRYSEMITKRRSEA
jgi:hypothetical protein